MKNFAILCSVSLLFFLIVTYVGHINGVCFGSMQIVSSEKAFNKIIAEVVEYSHDKDDFHYYESTKDFLQTNSECCKTYSLGEIQRKYSFTDILLGNVFYVMEINYIHYKTEPKNHETRISVDSCGNRILEN